jgi:hypothetical protein
VRPDGQAAAIAARQRIANESDGATTGRHHCHRGNRGRTAPASGGSGRV